MTEEQIDRAYIKSLGLKDKSIIEIRSSRQNLSFRMFEYYLSSADIHYSKDTLFENFSNGSLPDNFSKEDFYRGISRPVNKELTDIYTKLHLIEQSGHGVPIVVKQYGEKAFEFGTSFIIVTIPFEQPFVAKNTVSNANARLNNCILPCFKNNISFICCSTDKLIDCGSAADFNSALNDIESTD